MEQLFLCYTSTELIVICMRQANAYFDSEIYASVTSIEPFTLVILAGVTVKRQREDIFDSPEILHGR